jgi:ribonucleoside-diphosphate reductase alpha chain
MNALASPDPGAADVAELVWRSKYQAPGETSVAGTQARVAKALAAVERDPAAWAGRFADLLAGYRFVPGGRILAGAGTERSVTLFNCFVMGRIEDSIPGIFRALQESAVTMQQGGGVGLDFSSLRPLGAPALGTGGVASGPVSFMRLWDAMCETLLSTGARRGAIMGVLRCDHPDIEAFIDAKREGGRLTHFNLSVLVTDAFMAAVRADGPWTLRFDSLPARTISARQLWRRLLEAAFESAEPGVLFIDRINRTNALSYCEEIGATNPCGEVPLPAYGACDLGSFNLTRFVEAPFAADARLDLEELAALVPVAVRLLDDVIDASRFPLPQQAEAARRSRRVGLGITGLADALVMLGLDYGEPQALEVARAAMRAICHGAYRASVELAREKGPFPAFDRDAYLAGDFAARLPADIRYGIAQHGLRNSHLLAIAPAGTISLLAGAVSSGLEPIFAAEYERAIVGPDGERRSFRLTDYALALWRAGGRGGLPPAMRTAEEVTAQAQIEMQAALQPFVDNAISKTVSVPEATSFEDFARIYDLAYDRGLKGCTAFRPNPARGQVLAKAAEEAAPHCCSVDREAD